MGPVPDGGWIAVLVTKSVDSYRALDELVAAAGLDRDACRPPSLYQPTNQLPTASTGNQ